MLTVHHGIMAQGLVASNKNGGFQTDFGTLVCWGFSNYGAVIFV
jgi:hypothetical protein